MKKWLIALLCFAMLTLPLTPALAAGDEALPFREAGRFSADFAASDRRIADPVLCRSQSDLRAAAKSIWNEIETMEVMEDWGGLKTTDYPDSFFADYSLLLFGVQLQFTAQTATVERVSLSDDGALTVTCLLQDRVSLYDLGPGTEPESLILLAIDRPLDDVTAVTFTGVIETIEAEEDKTETVTDTQPFTYTFSASELPPRNPAAIPAPGDVDGNGQVNASDALHALKAAVGKITLSTVLQRIADLDGDGKVTASDALAILTIAVGKVPGATADANAAHAE